MSSEPESLILQLLRQTRTEIGGLRTVVARYAVGYGDQG